MVKLLPHQEEALKLTEDLNRVAYYYDMGLGKTFIGSYKMMLLNSRVNLVVCQKSKVRDWLDHFELYSDTYYNHNLIYDLTDKNALQAFLDVAADHGYTQRIIGVINYDLIFRRSDLLKLKNFTLMLDESSMIQNETAKRSKAILKMKPENVILLSGTPTAGRYEKLWSQCRLLGWDIKKKVFWSSYIISQWVDIGGFMHQMVVGYKNVDHLKKKLREHGAVFMKTEDVLDLPDQEQINLFVDVIPQYRKFMKTGMVTVNGHQMTGDTSLTKRLYARQLCGSFNKGKLQAFRDLISSTDDRIIVFYNFYAELDALLDIAREEGKPVSLVNGSVKDLEQYEHSEQSVTFVQYQAGAMGLNLQKANKVVYFTLPERSELFEQSKKRIHRIGQGKTCFYYYLLCRKSVEIDILNTLKMRKDYTDALFKEKYDS